MMTYKEYMVYKVMKLHKKLTVRAIAKRLRVDSIQVLLLLKDGLEIGF